jgi:hypothetical protein
MELRGGEVMLACALGVAINELMLKVVASRSAFTRRPLGAG